MGSMDYSKYQALEVTANGPIVTVTLNRPEVRNVINGQMHDELATRPASWSSSPGPAGTSAAGET